VSIVDGRDHAQIEHALRRRHPDRPNVVIAQVERKF
jgi:transketolase N-terminal domain/subunit